MPAWAFTAGRVGSTLVTSAVLVATTLGLGTIAYDVNVRMSTLPGLIVTLVLGSVCFTTLGLGVTAIIPNADSAVAITNLLIMPLTFISGIWMVLTGAPGWLDTTAKIFPVRALAHGLQFAFDPATHGNGIVWTDVMVLGIWTLVGLRICQRWFRWESRR